MFWSENFIYKLFSYVFGTVKSDAEIRKYVCKQSLVPWHHDQSWQPCGNARWWSHLIYGPLAMTKETRYRLLVQAIYGNITMMMACNPFWGAAQPLVHPCQIPTFWAERHRGRTGNPFTGGSAAQSMWTNSCKKMMRKKTKREICRVYFLKDLAEEAESKLVEKSWNSNRTRLYFNGYTSTACGQILTLSALTSKQKVKFCVTKYASKSEPCWPMLQKTWVLLLLLTLPFNSST